VRAMRRQESGGPSQRRQRSQALPDGSGRFTCLDQAFNDARERFVGENDVIARV
jgi:hypothetical protein